MLIDWTGSVSLIPGYSRSFRPGTNLRSRPANFRAFKYETAGRSAATSYSDNQQDCWKYRILRRQILPTNGHSEHTHDLQQLHCLRLSPDVQLRHAFRAHYALFVKHLTKLVNRISQERTILTLESGFVRESMYAIPVVVGWVFQEFPASLAVDFYQCRVERLPGIRVKSSQRFRPFALAV